MGVSVMLTVIGLVEGTCSLHVYFGDRRLVKHADSALPLRRRCSRGNAGKPLLSYCL